MSRRAVLIRCDGSPEIGLGHVVRCLALGRLLRDRHGLDVTFAMRDGPLGFRMVRDAGFQVVEAPGDAGADLAGWLIDAIKGARAAALVVDARDDLRAADLRTIRDQAGIQVTIIDDVSERRLAADDVFLPPVPQARALAWPGFEGRAHIGWEWVLLRPEFAATPHRPVNERPVVLVSMGGSDPAGLTLLALRALSHVPGPVAITVLLGPGFEHDANVAALLDRSYPHVVRVVRNGDVRHLMLEADLAALSFGVTAYEAAACALPAVHLCLTDDHARSSTAFADAGIAVSLGLAERVGEGRLAAAIKRLVDDDAQRMAMGARARRLVDGGGGARIARELAGRRSA